MDNDRFSLRTYLRPLEEFIQSDDTETIGTVLQMVDNCHDPVFIFNKKEQLLGMINAYQALYRQSYPYTKNVSNCYIHPPDIQGNTTLFKVFEVMRDTGFYTLPVFDSKKEIAGVVRAKDILKGIIEDDLVLEYLSQSVKIQDPVTAGFNITVKDIQDVLKNNDKSRVIIVDVEGQVAGIVTRTDIAHAFIEPTDKQRFSHNGQSGEMAYDGEEKQRTDALVKKFMSVNVYTASLDQDMKNVMRDLITSEYNSVVLVDIFKKPVGIVTIHDLIQTISGIQTPIEVPIVFQKPTDAVSERELEKAEDQLYRFLEKLSKRQSILKLEVTFKEPKYANGKTAEFNTTIVVDCTSGISYVAHVKSTDFLASINDAIEDIIKQELRRRRSRPNGDSKRYLLNLLAS